MFLEIPFTVQIKVKGKLRNPLEMGMKIMKKMEIKFMNLMRYLLSKFLFVIYIFYNSDDKECQKNKKVDDSYRLNLSTKKPTSSHQMKKINSLGKDSSSEEEDEEPENKRTKNKSNSNGIIPKQPNSIKKENACCFIF